jgi:hypothetical protein
MTKGEETRLRNLIAKSKSTEKMTDLEIDRLQRLQAMQKSQSRTVRTVKTRATADDRRVAGKETTRRASRLFAGFKLQESQGRSERGTEDVAVNCS